MLKFGKLKMVDGYTVKTPVFRDGTFIGDIVSTTIGHQFDANEAIDRHEKVYPTLQKCKEALV